MTANIKDLLKQYAEICKRIGGKSCFSMFDSSVNSVSAESLEAQRGEIESQIIKLFEEAKSERAECAKLVAVIRHMLSTLDHKFAFAGVATLDPLDDVVVLLRSTLAEAEAIAKAIDERGNQADGGKAGE